MTKEKSHTPNQDRAPRPDHPPCSSQAPGLLRFTRNDGNNYTSAKKTRHCEEATADAACRERRRTAIQKRPPRPDQPPCPIQPLDCFVALAMTDETPRQHQNQPSLRGGRRPTRPAVSGVERQSRHGHPGQINTRVPPSPLDCFAALAMTVNPIHSDDNDAAPTPSPTSPAHRTPAAC